MKGVKNESQKINKEIRRQQGIPKNSSNNQKSEYCTKSNAWRY